MSLTMASATAPTRIDLAGGTLDIWPLNLLFPGAVTLNMAISIRVHASASLRDDCKIVLISEDQGIRKQFASINALEHDHELGLLSRLAGHFAPEGRGVEVMTRSLAPAGAGLAGSSALTIAVCGAMLRLVGKKLPKEKLIHTARDTEAGLLGIPTGLQDYGSAVYGGVHAFRFPPGGMVREKLAGAGKLLSRRVLLFYSGKSRSSGVNNWKMFRKVIDKDRKTLRLFTKIAQSANRAVTALKANDIHEFDQAIADEWTARRALFPAISTPKIDRAIREGKRAGAACARILGAGGGGCFFMLADPENHEQVTKAVERTNCKRLTFSLSKTGLEIYNGAVGSELGK